MFLRFGHGGFCHYCKLLCFVLSSADNTVMTVRRYSINSSLTGVSVKEARPDGNPQSDSGWGRLQDAIQHHSNNSFFGASAGVSGGKTSSRHSLQEYVHKNRYAEICASSQPVLLEGTSRYLSFAHKGLTLMWMNLCRLFLLMLPLSINILFWICGYFYFVI